MTSVLKIISRSIRSPAPVAPQIPLVRRILLTPRIYDMVSQLVQLYWSRYISRATIPFSTNDEYYRHVQNYNAGVTVGKQISVTRRAERLFPILRLPPRELRHDKLLLVGPRNVQELFTAWLYGFSWKNILGIDLYQTHPKIQVMNMEAMSFGDGSFDAILMSNTLAYAKDVAGCLRECSRVLKPGGVLVFGQTYCPDGNEFQGNKTPGEATKKALIAESLIPYYYQQYEKTNSLGLRQTEHVFGVRKRDTSCSPFDPVIWS